MDVALRKVTGLSFSTYRFNLTAIDDIALQEFNGSTWRGVFGHSLKKVACTTDKESCNDCMLSANCAYPYIFETSPPQNTDRMRKYSFVPHPFVIKKTKSLYTKKNGSFVFEILLIGKGQDYLAYIVQSVIHAGKIGISKSRSKFTLTSVQYLVENNWKSIWHQKDVLIKHEKASVMRIPSIPKSKIIQIEFQTPLRVVNDNKLITAEKFRFSHLFHSVSRRISMLGYFHEGIEFDVDYKQLLLLADTVDTLFKKMKNVQWKRYSSRQNRMIDVSAVMGVFCIDLNDKECLWPFIWMGSFIHAGKLTSMGLGEYEVKELASLP